MSFSVCQVLLDKSDLYLHIFLCLNRNFLLKLSEKHVLMNNDKCFSHVMHIKLTFFKFLFNIFQLALLLLTT